jgi:hypothetical protein
LLDVAVAGLARPPHPLQKTQHMLEYYDYEIEEKIELTKSKLSL